MENGMEAVDVAEQVKHEVSQEDFALLQEMKANQEPDEDAEVIDDEDDNPALNDVVDEILDDEEDDSFDPADLIEQPIVKADEDDTTEVETDTRIAEDESRYDYLFNNETDPTLASSEAPTEEVKAIEPTATDELPKHLQAGTNEYFASIKNYAITKVEEALGKDAEGDQVEYNEFDTDHLMRFNHFVNKAQKLVDNEVEEVKTVHKSTAARKKASDAVDVILSTPELGNKFLEIFDNMKNKDVKKLEAAAANNDYSGHIAIANRVKKVYGKVAAINKRKSNPKQREEPQTDGDMWIP